MAEKKLADTGRKFNVHKTLRRRSGQLLNVLCTFNLRHVSTGKEVFLEYSQNSQEKTCARASFLIKLQVTFFT